jgi:hypothetical protein
LNVTIRRALRAVLPEGLRPRDPASTLSLTSTGDE